MRLVIEENDLIDIKFIKWLIKRIKKLIILKCNSRKLSSIQNYVDNNNPFNTRNKISINGIILQASQNIIFYKHKSYFYIMVNPIIRAQGMDLKLEDVCKFINYGNFEMPGYPLFTNIYFDIKDNIKEYLKQYLIEMS